MLSVAPTESPSTSNVCVTAAFDFFSAPRGLLSTFQLFATGPNDLYKINAYGFKNDGVGNGGPSNL